MVYLYRNDQTGEVREVAQGMNDEHTYEADGVLWARVFTIPNAAIDTRIDGFSKAKFLEKTNKPGSYGDVLDRAKEFSDKRAQQTGGADPIKQKAFDEYSKQRKGRKHPEQTKVDKITI